MHKFGVCLGNKEPAGKRRRSRTKKGTVWFRRAMCEGVVLILGVNLALAPVDCRAQAPNEPAEPATESDVSSSPSQVTTSPRVQQRWPSRAAFLASAHGAAFGPLSELPIRTEIEPAVARSVRSLCAHMNWDRSRLPPLSDPANRECLPYAADRYPELYWGSNRRVDGSGYLYPGERAHAFDTGVAHVVGRMLWGFLLAEETSGIRPPGRAVEVLRQYCREMYENPDHLGAFVDPAREYRRFIVCHDIREGFLGLLALARARDDEWAVGQAREVLATLEKITDEAGHLSLVKSQEAGMQDRLLGAGNDATTSGRLVEPLIEYYEFSGEERALLLAGRYARATHDSTFTPQGRFRKAARSGGHIHSITSSLCGITRYAILANDEDLLRKCRQIMDIGVDEYASSWGWVDEVTPDHPANEIGRGEINQTGDVIRTSLLLGAAGYPEYYELAERYLRGTLLPVQHRQTDLAKCLTDNDSPQGDPERDVPQRVVGGYAMFLPNDRVQPGEWPLTTPDIISGAVHGLCECRRHQCTSDREVWRVNLLLDFEGDGLTLRSGLPQNGEISFRTRAAKTLLIRLPGWVDPDTLELVVAGRRQPVVVEGGYIRITGLGPGGEGVLRFLVPCKVEKETVDGTEYTTTWLGNQIIEILPRGLVSPLPF